MQTRIVLSFLVLLLLATSTHAQRTPRMERVKERRSQMAPHELAKAKRVLRRTNATIHHAKKQLAEHQNKTGDLAKAVSHQRYAISLLRRGMDQRAMAHSRRARRLAFASIQANQGQIPEEMQFTDEDGGDEGFSDDQLDADLERAFGSQVVLEDDRILEDALSDLDE